MTYHNGIMFSTKDNDNDNHIASCATLEIGAWWYNNCSYSNLNGAYFGRAYQGIMWYRWKNSWESLKFSKMKICCSSTCT